MKLRDICSALKAAIDATDFFQAQTIPAVKPAVACIIDDGTQHAAIEEQLSGNGFVVVIPPLLSAVNSDTSAHSNVVQTEVECVVRILSNPTQNAAESSGARRDIYESIEAACSAVASASPSNGAKRFRAAPNLLQLISVDEGLLGYDLTFLKFSTVN